ncbi:unnamed protein product [Symbiodinium sp. CCMP2456]|nr:unnamed protein product [Symbiodinium sp. CCMP2456]
MLCHCWTSMPKAQSLWSSKAFEHLSHQTLLEPHFTKLAFSSQPEPLSHARGGVRLSLTISAASTRTATRPSPPFMRQHRARSDQPGWALRPPKSRAIALSALGLPILNFSAEGIMSLKLESPN